MTHTSQQPDRIDTSSTNPGSEFTIRRSRPDDFLDLAALDRHVWADDGVPGFVADGEHAWRLWVEHAHLLVAHVDGKIVGASLMFASENRDLYLLHKLFVAHRHHGRGIGTALFEALTADLDRMGMTCLMTTSPGNARMLRLCARFGFDDKRLAKSYYGPGKDRYVIVRHAT